MSTTKSQAKKTEAWVRTLLLICRIQAPLLVEIKVRKDGVMSEAVQMFRNERLKLQLMT
ncbi:hypothetical protein [Psychrobacter sp. AOP31-A1-22]|uniref:hypothetical protein n=1 Tax=Psychrobacter sp. AOP31-A1-22 TaxID=3457696 RepID=UPI004035BB6D